MVGKGLPSTLTSQNGSWNPPATHPTSSVCASPCPASSSLSPLRSRLPGTHIQVSLVDLVDDLQVPGEQLLHQVHGPALQRLGKHRVVGVGKGPFGDVPGLAGHSQCSVPPQAPEPTLGPPTTPSSSSQCTPVKPSLTAPRHSQQPPNWLLHHRQVGASEGDQLGRPYLIPRQLLDVHENPHQLRDGHGRVRVIQLDGNLGEQGGMWGHRGDTGSPTNICIIWEELKQAARQRSEQPWLVPGLGRNRTRSGRCLCSRIWML